MSNHITRIAYKAANSGKGSPFYLIQTGADLPYGDKSKMMLIAQKEGLSVYDLGGDYFMIDNVAIMTRFGVTKKRKTNNI